MFIKSLLLRQFRNYEELNIDWHRHINILAGLNAQGKSNLLEAIFYLSLATSFRPVNENELLAWNNDFFYIEGQIYSQNLDDFSLSAAYQKNKGRRYKLNNQALSRRSDVIGLLHSVTFSPEDINIVKAGPNMRRRYLNQQICQIDKGYTQQLLIYNRIIACRNALLKQKNIDFDALSSYNQQLIKVGSLIIYKRLQILSELKPLIAQNHYNLSGGEQVKISYKSFIKEDIEDLGQIELIFEQELAKILNNEINRKVSLLGPHRDDFLIEIEQKTAKFFASQGQQRTIALALKLAELDLAKAKKGEWPILLLDDVLSELDQNRAAQLLKTIDQEVQIFITSTSNSIPFSNGQVWQIENGVISKLCI